MTLLITGTSQVAKEALKQRLLKVNPNAPLEVIDLYYELEPQWGIRADTLIAQMLHETDFLRSWWSSPPRRNMAGIGVTGHSQTGDPHSNAFAFKPEDGRWYQGYSFPDWRAAVQAHYGHMSAYVYPDERNNASQVDPRYRAAREYFTKMGWPLASVMTDLNGKWAVPGTTYGQSIEKLLNEAGAGAGSNPPPAAPGALQITDLTGKLLSGQYDQGRGPYRVQMVILHDTAGSARLPDSNSLPVNFAAREWRTIEWFTVGGQVSIHYLIGPEATGAKIYRLCREQDTAYHCAGDAQHPWTAPDGKVYSGQFEGTSVMNLLSIGIERWGIENETPGPNQSAAMLALVVDLARRYNLKPEQILSHADLQGNRRDGRGLLGAARAAVAELWNSVAATGTTLTGTHTETGGQAASLDLPQAVAEPVAGPPPGLTLNPPIIIGEPVASPPPNPEPQPGNPTGNLPAPEPVPIVVEGVEGVMTFLGNGVTNSEGVPVRALPRTDAPVQRNLGAGVALRFNAFTDRGPDLGLGSRWFMIDPADGGGWIYSGSVDS